MTLILKNNTCKKKTDANENHNDDNNDGVNIKNKSCRRKTDANEINNDDNDDDDDGM